MKSRKTFTGQVEGAVNQQLAVKPMGLNKKDKFCTSAGKSNEQSQSRKKLVSYRDVEKSLIQPCGNYVRSMILLQIWFSMRGN